MAMIFIFPTPINIYLEEVPELQKTDQYPIQEQQHFSLLISQL